jgi:hypothetical protein
VLCRDYAILLSEIKVRVRVGSARAINTSLPNATVSPPQF